NESFRRTAEGLKRLGIWGMELNIKDLDHTSTRDIGAIRSYLAGFGLELSMFASGLTAKTLGLSLSVVDEAERERAVAGARAMIRWVAGTRGQVESRFETPIGIIVGFLKGGVSPKPDAARRSLVESLKQLVPDASELGVPLIIEATNRYESSVVNSIGEGISIIDEVTSKGEGRPGALQVLPDTFHMNIEEADMVESMRVGFEYYTSFHLSDNNRFFPGYGAIDFRKVVATLDTLGYQGRLAIEGNLRRDLVSDLSDAVEYLSPFVEV
ncbi:MAG TPA: sugar phosphate isomerase/epimerase family protein, partial [Spirochaetia bacterium]|nr:sugar phosphate isomerase/epimerase family protein [Spirochaetia bacterium]